MKFNELSLNFHLLALCLFLFQSDLFDVRFQSLSPGLAPLKGEGSLAPLRDSSPGRSLGNSLGANTGTLGGTPLGGSSLGRGSLGGGSLGGSLGKGPLGGGPKGGLGSSGRLSGAERHMDPFQQTPLGGVKDPPGVSARLLM